MNTHNPTVRQQTLQHSRKRLMVWTAVWLVTLFLAYTGHRYLWADNAVFTGLMIGLNVIAGGAMMWANKRLLNGLDELEQQIQLQAMALTLGVGLVAGFAYAALAETGLIGVEAKIAHLAVLMSLTYLIGIYRGAKQYQ